jgi:nickel/cobalt exporter
LRLVLVFLALVPTLADAHPHEWIDAAAELIFDPQGQLAAIRHHWRFDEGFTAFALQGLDTNHDGKYSKAELEPLAQENVESLKEYVYFTVLLSGDDEIKFAKPTDYHIDRDGDRLVLHFTLPLAAPLKPDREITLQIYDPEYFIDFSFPSIEAARLVNGPGDCLYDVYPAPGPDPDAAALLATVGMQRDLPASMQGLAAHIDNDVIVDCGPNAAALRSERLAPHNAADAAEAMADGIASANIDLRAGAAAATDESTVGAASEAAPLPKPRPPADQEAAPAKQTAANAPAPSNASAAPVQPASPPAAPPRIGPLRYLIGKAMALQAAFYLRLTGDLKAVKDSGHAFAWLAGISFLYGIVHAAGPGHGKVVISGYLLANEERVRRGVLIAFIAALAQAAVAVGIIAIMAAILDMTSIAITSTTRLFESGSFALIAGLGIYLLVRKGRDAWASLEGGDPHAHHHHHFGVDENEHHSHHGHLHAHHSHAHAHHACSHIPAPQVVARPGVRGAAAAIVSVGLRPCSGALIVLVFALSQDIFWAGIASTFVMAVGTAITVASLAGIAVGAKWLARRIVGGGEGQMAARIMLGLELLAALVITASGATLFVGSLVV